MLSRSTNLRHSTEGAQPHEGSRHPAHRSGCRATNAMQTAPGPVMRARVTPASIGPQAPPSQPAHPPEAPPVGSEEYHRRMQERLRQQRALMQGRQSAARNVAPTTSPTAAPAAPLPTSGSDNLQGASAPPSTAGPLPSCQVLSTTGSLQQTPPPSPPAVTATAAPSRGTVRRSSKPAAPALPDLLPGLSLNKQQRRTASSSSVVGGGSGSGPADSSPYNTHYAASTRRQIGGNVFVGSTRSAKADFAVVTQSPQLHRFPSSGAATQRASSTEAANVGEMSYFSPPGGYGIGASGPTRLQNAGGSAAASPPAPMHRRSALDLNPFASTPSMTPSSVGRQAPTPAAATAPRAASAPPHMQTSPAGAAAAAAGALAGAVPMAGAAAASGVSGSSAGSTALSAAGPAPAAGPTATPTAAAAAAPAKQKRAARPAALWMTSFMQAGMAGGSGAAGGGAAAVAPARTKIDPSASKVAPVDAGAAAAAMIRKAVDLPATDLAAAVRDLQTPIPELQSRLEAAVQAEQESERRALRALYASGSLRQLQREGVVLVGLAAAEAGRLYRSILWRFSVGPSVRPSSSQGPRGKSPPSRGTTGGSSGGGGGVLAYHKLRPGASVIITPHVEMGGTARRGRGGGKDGGGGDDDGLTTDADTGLPSGGVEGVVVEAHRDHLMVALEGRAHERFQAMVTVVGEAMTDGRTAGAVRSGGGGGFQGWRLDQSVRDTTTRRHLEGIRRLGMWTEAQGEARLGEARVRSVLVGSRSAAVLAAEPPEWVKEDRWREDARTALSVQPGLNDSQRRAVAAALTRTVTLWQGPPGTGKTRTLLALIELLVRVRRTGGDPSGMKTPSASSTHRPRTGGGGGGSGNTPTSVSVSGRAAAMGPVLAVADTNAAVDNIVEGLGERGVAVVRLGPAAKARDSLRHLSLEAQAELTPLGRKAVALRTQALAKQERWRQSADGRTSFPSGDVASLAIDAEIRAGLERSEVMLREAATVVVAAAEVVVATCTSAGDSMLDGRPWRCVVVDEASQATEPSVLVALTRGAAFVVMAGDPRQLPPTVLSEEALQHGLDVTLFERVAVAGGVTPMLLDMQYRMHPAISAFPCAYFYGGKLRDGVGPQDKPIPRGFSWPNAAKPLAVLSVSGGREETSGGLSELAAAGASSASAASAAAPGSAKGPSASGTSSASGGTALLLPRGKKGTVGSDGGLEAAAATAPKSTDRASYRNSVEALLALAVTQRLLAAGDISSAAILTPYRGQVRLLEALARQQGLEAAWQAAGLEVCVSTVDGYQGREADVVVFSAVRANERGAVGFLSDPRRMNVAITRPRRGLVVLADTATLTRGSADWAMYIKWARSQGVLVADSDVIDVEAVLQRRNDPSTTASTDTNDEDDDFSDAPIAAGITSPLTTGESSAQPSRSTSAVRVAAAAAATSSDPRDVGSMASSGDTNGGRKRTRKKDSVADGVVTAAGAKGTTKGRSRTS